jgi:hypothetical protein
LPPPWDGSGDILPQNKYQDLWKRIEIMTINLINYKEFFRKDVLEMLARGF